MSIGLSIQCGRRNTSSSSALDRPSDSYAWRLWLSLKSLTCTTPVLCPLQMELVELQCNDELKAKFYKFSPLSFFRSLFFRDITLPSRNFPKYIAHVQRIVPMFGGTYCCEQLFSKMKCTKSRLRSLLSDRHLNDILLLSSSSVEPGNDILLRGKQHQLSHWFARLAMKVLLLYTSSFWCFRLSLRPTSCSGKSHLALTPAPALRPSFKKKIPGNEFLCTVAAILD